MKGAPLIHPAPRPQPGQPVVEEGVAWPESQLLMDPSVAYHFHFVNVGRDRSRNRFVGDATVDARAQETIRSQMKSPRGAALKRKQALVREKRKAAAGGGAPARTDEAA